MSHDDIAALRSDLQAKDSEIQDLKTALPFWKELLTDLKGNRN
jgi:hypothetical protein